MAPNHGADPLGSILGRKWVKTAKIYHAPKFNFLDYNAVIAFSKKKERSGYGAKSRWGRPKVHLAPLGQKMGQNRKKLPCPKIQIFDYPAVINFSQK